jgi:hypothetical protein
MSAQATVQYHVRQGAPQAFEFDVDGVLGRLKSPELLPTTVCVADLRGDVLKPNFEDDGIVFVSSPTRVTDFEHGTEWRPAYEQELTELLKAQIGAKEVIVFDHTVRIDRPDAVRRPARNVHNDYNRASAEQRLVEIVGEDCARAFHLAGFGFVNVWRPVEQVIRSSPLGFIWPRSMRREDWMDIDLIYPDRVGQILGVAANPDHAWFYTSGMRPDEAAIFNIYDNRGRPHLAHSALDLQGDAQATSPRKSIESRTLVRYAHP